jgi:hypothetical protein
MLVHVSVIRNFLRHFLKPVPDNCICLNIRQSLSDMKIPVLNLFNFVQPSIFGQKLSHIQVNVVFMRVTQEIVFGF